MDLHLTDEETEILRWMLKRELGYVREEAYKTEDSEYKRVVKNREALVLSVLSKVVESADS